MTIGIGTRLAGKVLGDFLGKATPMIGSAVEQAVLDKLVGMYVTPKEAANTGIGKAVTKLGPENIAKAAGVAAQAGTAGGITFAGANLINRLPNNQPFTNQQYVPGSLPMTNYQAGESFLSQQRFQQELALMRAQQYSDQLKYQNQLGILQARQNASNPQRIGYGTGIDLSEDMFSAPAQIYQ